MKTWISLWALVASVQAADWPQFLGPARDGHVAAEEKALPDNFSGDPKVQWEHPLGSGHTGPVVVEGKVIIVHRQGGDVVIEALEAKTGKSVW